MVRFHPPVLRSPAGRLSQETVRLNRTVWRTVPRHQGPLWNVPGEPLRTGWLPWQSGKRLRRGQAGRLDVQVADLVLHSFDGASAQIYLADGTPSGPPLQSFLGKKHAGLQLTASETKDCNDG